MENIVINNISTSYFITEDGRCYNSNTKKFLKGQISKSGYVNYYLTLPNGEKKRCYAHLLVAYAYLKNPKNKSQINHIDGNKLNNSSDNLEWVTPKENQQHALNLELRKFDHVFCFNEDKILVAEYKNIAEASAATKISRSIIQQETSKEKKALSGGFYWSKQPILGETIEYKNTGKKKKVFQYDRQGKFIMSYPSTGAAARALGLKNSSHIGECCRGKIKTYKGFIWRYSEDIVSPQSKD